MARENLSGLIHQGEHDLKLGRGQSDVSARYLNFIVPAVDSDRTGADNLIIRIADHPAQDHPGARNQFARTEGFGDLIIRPQFQPEQLVIFFGTRCEYNDRNIAIVANGATDLQSIHSRQDEIEHD